ncbi:MAG: dihydroorotase, partial [Cellvibrionales bacterium]
QNALIEVATSGDHRFFLGTDSAPHPRHAKESACGCAGCYSHHAAIELYAEVFDRAAAMHHLEAFASRHGADFYGLAYNRQTITLTRRPWMVPEQIDFDGSELIPLAAGQSLNWRLQN